MKNCFIVFLAIILSVNASRALNHTDSLNLTGIWKGKVDVDYKLLFSKDNKDSVKHCKLDFYILVNKDFSGYFYLNYNIDLDLAIFERSQLKIDSNSNFSFGFDALQINFFALNDSSSKVSAVSPIKETDIVGADSILQKVFPDNPEWTRINHTFDLYLHPVDWDEYRCSTKEGPAPFLNLQTRSWDGLNFRVGMDFISDIKFDCKPVLSFSPINFASQKLKDGTYMYSTNYLFWLPVAISMLSNYTFEYFPPDKPDWPTILLFIWDMPNFLFNGQIEFPFKSGCEYWAGVFGLKTDWYAWGEGEYGTLCWEPRIGIKYIHNKNIGFQINCVFPFWGDDVYNRDIYHVDLKFPYIGIDLLLYLSQDYANEIIR